MVNDGNNDHKIALFEEHIETEIFKYKIKDYDLEGKIEAKLNWNLMRMKLYFPVRDPCTALRD